MPCEDARRRGVGNPAAVADAVAAEHRQGRLGVTYAIDIQLESGRLRRPEEEAFELRVAFSVAPVADPDKARPALPRLLRRRMKRMRVGRFVPDEHLFAPAPLPIHGRKCLAERKHAVIAVEVEGTDRVRVADRSMVSVVEQQRKPAA